MRCQQSRSLQLAVKVLYGFVAFLVVTVVVLASLGEPPFSLASGLRLGAKLRFQPTSFFMFFSLFCSCKVRGGCGLFLLPW